MKVFVTCLIPETLISFIMKICLVDCILLLRKWSSPILGIIYSFPFLSFPFPFLLPLPSYLFIRVLEDTLYIKQIGNDDERIELRGQIGLFAKIFIPKDTVLGVYTGEMWTEEAYLKFIHSHCIFSLPLPRLFLAFFLSLLNANII